MPVPSPAVLDVPVTQGLGDLVLELSQRLDAAGIRHGFQRGHRELPSIRRGGDIDLALDRGDLHRFEVELQQVLWASGARIRDRHRTRHFRQYHLHLRTPEGEHQFLDLDVHLAECCFGVPFVGAKEMFSGPSKSGTVPEVGRVMGAWTDFLGPYLSGGSVKEPYREALQAVREDSTAREMAERWFGPKRGAALLASLEDEAALRRRAKGDRRALLRRSFFARPWESLRSMASFFCASRLRAFVRPRGLSIAFLGTDGAGKTTLLERIQEELDPAFRSDKNRVLKLRPGIIPQLDRVVHLGKRTQGPEDWARPHRAKPSGKLVSNLRVLYYGTDYVLGHFLRILPLRRRNTLLIFDRWFDDLHVDPLRFRVQPDSLAIRVLSKILPQPDATVVVTSTVENVQARKQEHTAEESARQIEVYERLASKGGRYHLVRNDGTIDEAVNAILDALFDVSEPPQFLDKWYPPTVRPLMNPAIGTAPQHKDDLATAYDAIGPGEALVFTGRAPVERWSRDLEDSRYDGWWVFPGTGGSHTLLPMDPRSFRLGTQLLPMGRLRWRLLRACLHAPLVKFLRLPEVHVVAKAPGEPGIAPRVAVSLGVPGMHRKAVLKLIGFGEDGRSIAKVALTEAAKDRIDHEAWALEYMARFVPAGSIAPRLIEVFPGSCLVQEAMTGRRSPDELGPDHLGLLETLDAKTNTEVAIARCATFEDCRKRLASFEGRVDAERLKTFNALADAIERRAGMEPIRVGMAHGDFTPWNLMQTPVGLRGFDWEFAEALAPALHDLCHFQLQTGVLVKHENAEELLASFDRGCAGPWAEHLSKLGVEDPSLYLALYLLHQTTTDQATNLVHRPPFVQVGWLEKARTELAQLLIDRFASA